MKFSIDKMGKCIIPVLVLLMCITIVSAVPQIPESYWGYATVNGAPAAYGTPITVEVYGTGEVIGSTSVQYQNAGYSLAIIFDDPDTPEDEGANASDKLSWKINSLICSIPTPGTDTATPGGIIGNFNLTATSVNDPPSVTVLYPNGSESIPIGTRVQVSAQATDDNAVSGVTFYYSRDGGSNWYLIGEGAKVSGTAKGGIWNKTWDTNGLNASPNYLIKAVASDGALTSEDWSDSTFSLTSSNVIYVLDDYPTIQAAVDAASPGNTIIVRDGTYIENVDVNKPNLTIRSENGAESCIVQAANSVDHVFEVTADHVTVSGFTVKGATKGEAGVGMAGICLNSVEYCNIIHNSLCNNYLGIQLGNSNRNTLNGNIVHHNIHDGIRVAFSNRNDLKNNTMNLNDVNGLAVLYSSNNNAITDNTLYSNAIYLQTNAEFNLIQSNEIYSSSEGIVLHDCNSNYIKNNNIHDNTISGIRLTHNSSNNIISNNQVGSNNNGMCLYFSSNNSIYQNNFINNNENARSTSSTNIWNSPSKLTYVYNDNTHTCYLGNYWDDYSGRDANGDGIGDIPYRIDLDNDFYPLKAPFENYFKPPPSSNLLKNPDFEDQLLYWTDTKDSAIYTDSDQEPHGGFNCAKGVEVNKGNLGRLYQDVTGLVNAGDRYKIGGWIKTEAVVGNVVIALDYVDENGWCPADGYVKEIGHVTGTTDWTYYESEWFTLPPMPEDGVAAWFLFDFNNGRGTAYWDDVSLTPKPTPTPPPAEEGSISIHSSPSGASIGLETPVGMFVGPTVKTPHTFTAVPVGTSTITLSLDGYQDWSTNVKVTAGETTYVDATLSSKPTPPPPITRAIIVNKSSGWGHTFSPTGDWVDIDYDTSRWVVGKAPFANLNPGACISGITIFPLNTTLYVRYEFELEKIPTSGKLYLAYDNDISVYLNGQNVYSKQKEGCGAYWNDEITISGFNKGKNALVCVVKDRGVASFFDAKLIAYGISQRDVMAIFVGSGPI